MGIFNGESLVKRSRVLLIDANPTRERKNEGKLIREFLDIIEVKSDHERVKSKRDLLNLLEKSKHRIIHISAHGEKDGICVGRGKVTADDILNVGEKRKAGALRKIRLIICSACHGGSEDIASAFSKAICRLYLGPKRETYWIDTAFLSIYFYDNYYRRGLTLEGSIDSAFKKRYYRGVWFSYP
jgi:hypothetical protein